jgi:hypothetical protein
MTCETCIHHNGKFCGRFAHPASQSLAVSASFALTERCFGRMYEPTEDETHRLTFLAAVKEKGEQLVRKLCT